jgi:hypothetical protein
MKQRNQGKAPQDVSYRLSFPRVWHASTLRIRIVRRIASSSINLVNLVAIAHQIKGPGVRVPIIALRVVNAERGRRGAETSSTSIAVLCGEEASLTGHNSRSISSSCTYLQFFIRHFELTAPFINVAQFAAVSSNRAVTQLLVTPRPSPYAFSCPRRSKCLRRQ